MQNAPVSIVEKIIQKKVEQPICYATEQPHVSWKQSTPKKQQFPKETPRDVHTEEYLETVEKCTGNISKIEIGQRAGQSVYVSHIETPGKFWIQHAENQQSIVDINSELLDIGIEANSKYLLDGPLVVGQLYSVKHPEFGSSHLITYFLLIINITLFPPRILVSRQVSVRSRKKKCGRIFCRLRRLSDCPDLECTKNTAISSKHSLYGPSV